MGMIFLFASPGEPPVSAFQVAESRFVAWIRLPTWVAGSTDIGSGSRCLWSRAVQIRHRASPLGQVTTRQVRWPARRRPPPKPFLRAPSASRHAVTLISYRFHGLRVTAGSGLRYLWSRAVQTRHHPPPQGHVATRQACWPVLQSLLLT